MPTRAKSAKKELKDGPLTAAFNRAWDALQPIRSTWDEKEQALMAQTNDSVSGNITATRVSDAAISTLAYERQARVTAQLPTGRVYAMSKSDDKKAKLLNIILNRYILPNANSQFDMLIKLRLWGVYASVYGSMPMFYDYRSENGYIGPEAYLVDPRCFALTPGFHSVQEAPAGYISTIMSKDDLEAILKRKTTSYDKTAVRKLLSLMEGGKASPSRDQNSQKNNTAVGQRYDLSNAKDRVEVVNEYRNDRWLQFAPDFADMEKGEDMIIRDMDNPHKSGRKPIVMRHCFPLLNSVFGLGDFERGMKVQKAKDSIINLFLEGAKNRVYPPLKMIDNALTPSTIRYQAGTKWKVKRQDAVEAMSFGDAPLAEFQATYAALQGILQNMFGTSTTEISENEGGPAMGKTPQALKMQASRENARDTWDRFMGEKATEELLEGLINLLTVKMEKPINFAVFEEDMQALGYSPPKTELKSADGQVLEAGREEQPVQGLEAFEGGKAGKMTLNKKDLASDKGFSYLIDANSSMKQDDEEQFAALMATWELMHSDPELEMRLASRGGEYDELDHIKKIFIAAGITDWEKVLKEISPEKLAQIKAAQAAQAAAAQPAMPPGPPQMPDAGGLPPQMPMDGGMPPQLMPEVPVFQDPQIAGVASQLFGPRAAPGGLNG